MMRWKAPPPSRKCHESGCGRSLRSYCDGRYWHKADMLIAARNVRFWVKQTSLPHRKMSANDPKRTLKGAPNELKEAAK